MKLIENKVTDYRIVIPANPTESQRYAADELAKYLELISGAKLPVACDCSEPQEKEIVIGRTNREGAPCGCGLKNDGYTYKTVGDGETVTDQTPVGGSIVPNNATIILYMGAEKSQETCTVPIVEEWKEEEP